MQALFTVLDSFGSAKTTLNPNASRHATVLELYLNASGRLAGAKVLAWGLDKQRVRNLDREERTYHAFYQLLAGATSEERQQLGLLDDITDYRLLATSACYRMPPTAGPLADDSIAFEELRAALKTLGFKPRHVTAIFRLLSAILLLGNLQFEDHGRDVDYQASSAWVINRDTLEAVSHLLGVSTGELERSLTNRVSWVRKEMISVILKAEGADRQRDSLMAALYSILFAFVVETANHKMFPGDEAIDSLFASGGTSILQLDQPGFFSRSQERSGAGMLVRAMNGYGEFTNNYANELTQYWLSESQFDGDASQAARAQEDGLRMADVLPPDASGRIELLRGGRIGGKADRKPGGILGGMIRTCAQVRKGTLDGTDAGDEELLRGMKEHFGTHMSFIANPGGPGARSSFAIKHYAGQVTYDGHSFIEQELDAFDPDFVALLRSSNDSFIAKLLSGPSLAAEVHPLDDAIIVAAQVSSQPLRRLSPIKQPFTAAQLTTDNPSAVQISDTTVPLLDQNEIHPVSAQLNSTLAQVFNHLEKTKLWTVITLRPCDSLQPQVPIDVKRLKQQVAQLLLPELIARKAVDYHFDTAFEDFSDRHKVPAQREAIDTFLHNDAGLSSPAEYAVGTARVWLSYRAWRVIEDRLRSQEPPEHRDLAAAGARSGETSAGPQSPRGIGEVELPALGPSVSRSTFPGMGYGQGASDSVEDLLGRPTPYGSYAYGPDSPRGYAAGSLQPATPGYFSGHMAQESMMSLGAGGLGPSEVWGEKTDLPSADNGLPRAGFSKHGPSRAAKEGVLDQDGRPEEKEGATVEEVASSRGRRVWVAMVWAMTWWCPTVLLTSVGRMKRPDIRMAWREKVSGVDG